mgnify:CR=1 FL=1
MLGVVVRRQSGSLSDVLFSRTRFEPGLILSGNLVWVCVVAVRVYPSDLSGNLVWVCLPDLSGNLVWVCRRSPGLEPGLNLSGNFVWVFTTTRRHRNSITLIFPETWCGGAVAVRVLNLD